MQVIISIQKFEQEEPDFERVQALQYFLNRIKEIKNIKELDDCPDIDMDIDEYNF